MQASGQYTQQIWQRVHLLVSTFGRNVRHDPVLPVLASRGRESGVGGKSLIFWGAFAIMIHLEEKLVVDEGQRLKDFA